MDQPVNFLATDTDVTRPPFYKARIFWVLLSSGFVGAFGILVFFIFFYTPTNTVFLNAVMVLLRIPKPATELMSVVETESLSPHRIATQPVPQITAFSYVVEDWQSGTMLLSEKVDQSWPLASITKLMTALVILELQPDWSTTTTVIGADSLDTIMYAGDTYTLEELWDAMLIGSSNKAALSLASAMGMSEEQFVVRMNQKATEIGLSSSTMFVDMTGLSDGNIGTAQDVAKLIRKAVEEEKITTAMTTKEMALYSKERKRGRDVWSTNWLLLGWIPNKISLIGAKTGHTLLAAYNFTMIAKDEDNARPVIVVVLGAQTHESRFTEALILAQTAWQSYKWP